MPRGCCYRRSACQLAAWLLLPIGVAGDVRPLPEDVAAAITAPAAIKIKQKTLDLASADMVVGAPCSAAPGSSDACWPMLKKGAQEVRDGTRRLEFADTRGLLKYFGGGVSHGNYANLMSVPLMVAMHMVDPDSFFFACIQADGKLHAQQGSLVAVETASGGTPGLGLAPSYGCTFANIVLVLRRSGLQMALAGVPQKMAVLMEGDAFSESVGPTWQVEPSEHASILAMLEGIVPANSALVASFKSRMLVAVDDDDGNEEDAE